MAEQFQPFDGRLNYTDTQELQARGVMPAAMVCITPPDLNSVLAVVHNNEVSGLPLVDIPNPRKDESIEDYLAYRLLRRYNYRVPANQLNFLSYRSLASPHVSAGFGREFSNLHRRIYFPVWALANFEPDSSRLTFAPPQTVMDRVSFHAERSTRRQIIDLQHDFFSRLVHLNTNEPTSHPARKRAV